MRSTVTITDWTSAIFLFFVSCGCECPSQMVNYYRYNILEKKKKPIMWELEAWNQQPKRHRKRAIGSKNAVFNAMQSFWQSSFILTTECCLNTDIKTWQHGEKKKKPGVLSDRWMGRQVTEGNLQNLGVSFEVSLLRFTLESDNFEPVMDLKNNNEKLRLLLVKSVRLLHAAPSVCRAVSALSPKRKRKRKGFAI